jgi:Uma2 family endonuclease
LWEGQHYELIQGELINKMGKNLPHVRGSRRVVHALEQAFRWDLIATEAPIDVALGDNPTNKPEPDVYVLKTDNISDRNPRPEHLALVVEISDTTLDFDTTVKAALYARGGIPEYWVLDLNGRRLIVQRDPSGSVYKTVVAYSEQERLCALSEPEHQILVADLLAF